MFDKKNCTLLPLLWSLCTYAISDSTDINVKSIMPTLNILSWGGVYEEYQMKAYVAAFEKAHGVDVVVHSYDGDMQRYIESNPDQVIDVVDMTMSSAIKHCDDGDIKSIDWSVVFGTENKDFEEDLIESTVTDCAIGHSTFSTLMAFNINAYPSDRPKSINDFFDLDKFPGQRAVKKEASALLEWALYSYGIPKQQLYSLLSTERGLDLAFERLDEIRSSIVWWNDSREVIKLLKSGEPMIAIGYNGRFFDAQVHDKLPIEMIWQGQIYEMSAWAIPQQAQEVDLAQKFIEFAMRTTSQAKFANLIPYGPTRRSAYDIIGYHPEKHIPMLSHLPTTESHMQEAISKDYAWYNDASELINEKFDAWLAEE